MTSRSIITTEHVRVDKGPLYKTVQKSDLVPGDIYEEIGQGHIFVGIHDDMYAIIDSNGCFGIYENDYMGQEVKVLLNKRMKFVVEED